MPELAAEISSSAKNMESCPQTSRLRSLVQSHQARAYRRCRPTMSIALPEGERASALRSPPTPANIASLASLAQLRSPSPYDPHLHRPKTQKGRPLRPSRVRIELLHSNYSIKAFSVGRGAGTISARSIFITQQWDI